MAELTVPVLKFASEVDCQRAVETLLDQQFDVERVSATEIGCRPWSDLEEAQALLDAEGIACERTDKVVARKGPGPLPPRP